MSYYYQNDGKNDKEFQLLKSGYFCIGISFHNVFKSFKWIFYRHYMLIGAWGEGFNFGNPFFRVWFAINDDWLKIWRLYQ